MPRERVLIAVKTYPTLSRTHIELVCTAGVREDGSWVRIYPVPFRLMDPAQRFKKWTWVDLDLRRRERDRRPESYSPRNRDDIRIGRHIPAGERGWRDRRRHILDHGRVWTDLDEIIRLARANEISLATFRPTRMLGMEFRASAPDWDARQLARAEEQMRQGALPGDAPTWERFRLARKVPYDFFYRFSDEHGRTTRLRILDWELGMLYWRSLKSAGGDPQEAIAMVRGVYETRFFQCDLHFSLGTTYEWHQRSPNPWVIVGVFPPPPIHQPELF